MSPTSHEQPTAPAVSPTPPRSPELPSTMRAATRRRYGQPDQMAVETMPRPEPQPGEVLLRVGAAGIDRAILHLLTGEPLLARPAFGLVRPRQPILGQQVAGEVVAVGPGPNPYVVGQRVFGMGEATFAEYARAKPAQLAATPDGLSDADASTLGDSGITAWIAVVTHGQVQAGQRVLILGGSGAVGSYAVQLAVHRGAHVTAVCSAAKLDLVCDLGAHEAADYRTSMLADLAGPFEVIIDIGGIRPLAQLRSVLTPQGTLVIVGGEHGGRVFGGLHRNLIADVTNRFTRQRLGWMFAKTTTADLTELARLVSTGALRVPIDRRVGLAGVGEGLAAMQRGTLRGHVVVCPAQDRA